MLVTKTPVHIFLVILFLKYGVCVNLTLCYPAEEGRQHTLIFSLDINNLRLKFTIDNEKSFVTECLLETLYCSNEQSKKAFSVLEKKDLNDYTLNITIWNATRESDFGFEGLWTLTNDEDSNVFMSCSLKIFGK
ncbi:unnamed protein product [Lymnaea stagnalis]|uniref:Uncharacterized protein n=1 Tax=Lymnaea stagnalis TaxID=6523 RepID=A0AAV2IDS9_LYMST